MQTNSAAGFTLWLTGLSGAGKTTISCALSRFFQNVLGKKCFVLDGDKVRLGLNKDLKFSKEDRTENIRRVAQVSKLCNSEGMFVIVSCISPYAEDRKNARKIHQAEKLPFYQVFVGASLQSCEKRDIKGLYKLARQGKIPSFTGISDPYEIPENPDIVLQQKQQSETQSLSRIVDFLKQKGHIKYFGDNDFHEQISGYVDFEAGIQELNILQTIQQRWTDLTNLMDYNQIIQSIYFGNVTQNQKSSFQTMPLFFIAPSSLKEKSDQLMKGGNLSHFHVRVINKLNGKEIAVIRRAKFQKFRIQEICSKLFGTFAKDHPSIESWMKKGQYLLSGESINFKTTDILFNDGLDYLRKSPTHIRQQFSNKKGDCLYAFQFRNPLHNGHLFLLEQAKEQLLKKGFKKPVLLLHPCGGWVKSDDVPLQVRIKQHECLLENSQFFNSSDYILGIWPSPMFYAGPRQVLWHFSSRQKAGVNYMIVGRDPAGVKHPERPTQNLFDEYDGQRVLQQATKKGYININILPFKQISWNKISQKLEEFNPKKSEDYENISGSQMRKMAKEGTIIPSWFMNNKSWHVLSEYYRNKT